MSFEDKFCQGIKESTENIIAKAGEFLGGISGEEFNLTDINFHDRRESRWILIPTLTDRTDLRDKIKSVYSDLASEDCLNKAERAICATENYAKQAVKQYEDLVNEASSS